MKHCAIYRLPCDMEKTGAMPGLSQFKLCL